jgi:glutamate synthase domain-containing protein 3
MIAGANARTFDLLTGDVRELNAALHALDAGSPKYWRVVNPKGRHAVAVGLDAEVTVEVDGSVGYYCGGMNQRATIVVNGNAGTGVAENMMSGRVHVRGDASQSAGATGHGGLLVIDGNAAARCAIAIKGRRPARSSYWARRARRSAIRSTRLASSCAAR